MKTMIRGAWLLLFVGTVVAAAARGGAAQEEPGVAALQREFKALEQARGVTADIAKLAAGKCTKCHLGIENAAYRVQEAGRRKTTPQYVFVDPAVEKRIRDRHPQAADFLGAAKMYMAHPRLDLYASEGSRHPMSRFDCLDCHGADDRRAELQTARELGDWTSNHIMYHKPFGTAIDENSLPMVLTKLAQSSCKSCHGSEAEVLDGAEKYAAGHKVLEATACYACHELAEMAVHERHLPKKADGTSDDSKRARRPGPPLTHIADKMDKSFAYSFVLDPESYRPTTRMPRFFGRPSDARRLGRRMVPEHTPVVAASIVEYLYSISVSRKYDPSPIVPPADMDERDARVARGEEIVNQVGCISCHRADELYSDDFILGTYNKHLLEYGPHFVGLGDKFNSPRGRTWLYQWLKAPAHYFPDSKMPDLRLSEDELRDVIEFLCSLQINPMERQKFNERRREVQVGDVPIFVTRAGPFTFTESGVDMDAQSAQLLDEMAARFLKDTMKPEAIATLAPKEKILKLGERLVEHFGCYSCHNLHDAERKGTEDWQAKDPPGKKWSWKIMPGRGDFERMPFSNTPPEESDALLTYLMADTFTAPKGKAKPPSAQQSAVHAGQRVLTSHNCASCHQLKAERLLVAHEGKAQWCDAVVLQSDKTALRVQWLADPVTMQLNDAQKAFDKGVPVSAILDRKGPEGGTIVSEWDPKSMQMKDAQNGLKRYKQVRLNLTYPHEGHLLARMPPSLRLEGSRVKPDWLRNFLRKPEEIRPIMRPSRLLLGDYKKLDERILEMLGDTDMKAAAKAGELEDELNQLDPALSRTSDLRRVLDAYKAKGDESKIDKLLADARDLLQTMEINVRMGYFSLKEWEIEALVGYFSANGNPEPDAAVPDPALRAAELKPAWDTLMTTCTSCHVPGRGGWAPDLARAEQRLRPGWVAAYLKSPDLFEFRSLMPRYDKEDAGRICDILGSWSKAEPLLNKK